MTDLPSNLDNLLKKMFRNNETHLNAALKTDRKTMSYLGLCDGLSVGWKSVVPERGCSFPVGQPVASELIRLPNPVLLAQDGLSLHSPVPNDVSIFAGRRVLRVIRRLMMV